MNGSETMVYIKSSGEIVHQVNVRISDPLYQFARANDIRFSEFLEYALLQVKEAREQNE
jgi:post-segregation antitoxin (ccd killing protein)